MRRMDPEIKQKWIAALRSGEYVQVTNKLRPIRDKKICCVLGVLADISPWADEVPETATLPSRKVCEWAGIQRVGEFSWNPEVKWRGERRFITELNDYFKLDFNQLADIIDEQL